MLAEANKAIGSYALQLTNFQLFGLGRPNFIKTAQTLLYSYALSKVEYLSSEQVKDIHKKLTDLTL